jgi:hypothetical protein
MVLGRKKGSNPATITSAATFLVSAERVSSASAVLRAAILEAGSKQPAGLIHVEVPYFHPEVVRILLAIIHQAKDKIPTMLPPVYLAKVASAFHIFQIQELAKPYGQTILQNLSEDGAGNKWQMKKGDLLDWMFILLVFEGQKCFAFAAKKLLFSSDIGEIKNHPSPHIPYPTMMTGKTLGTSLGDRHASWSFAS